MPSPRRSGFLKTSASTMHLFCRSCRLWRNWASFKYRNASMISQNSATIRFAVVARKFHRVPKIPFINGGYDGFSKERYAGVGQYRERRIAGRAQKRKGNGLDPQDLLHC